MTRIPNPPVPGQNISVSFYRDLVQYLRDNRLVAGNNIRISRGVGGAVIDCTAQSKQTPQSGKAKDLGPFVPTYDDETGVMDGIGEGYIQTTDGTLAVDGVSFPLEGLEEDESSDSTSSDTVYSGVVAIKYQRPVYDDSDSASSEIADPEIVGFDSVATMMIQQGEEADTNEYIPIYQLDKSKIALDFRLLSYSVNNGDGLAVKKVLVDDSDTNIRIKANDDINLTAIDVITGLKLEVVDTPIDNPGSDSIHIAKSLVLSYQTTQVVVQNAVASTSWNASSSTTIDLHAVDVVVDSEYDSINTFNLKNILVEAYTFGTGSSSTSNPIFNATELFKGTNNIIVEPKSLKLNGVDTGAKIIATNNVDIIQKQLVQGEGITLTPSQDGKTITIASTNGGSNISGTMRVVHSCDYNVSTKRLSYNYENVTITKGVITARDNNGGAGYTQEYHQAVPEVTSSSGSSS